MTRLILTFDTVFQVLAAEKSLRSGLSCRSVPTPSGLSSSICGISVELLDLSQEAAALEKLESVNLKPSGIYKIAD
ncbi:MAG: DUF3343 domain-containing protein [Candidatus Obscuribacterales bacterium]|nr:DUF3343 domain-containing protein [Candidatus Obscuribacterales bacterium]